MRSEIYLPNLDKIVPVRSHLKEALVEAPWAMALLQKLSGYSPWTYEHSAKVAYLMGEMMENEGMSESGVLKAQRAGWLHDIGKIQIPLTVLDAIARSKREEEQWMNTQDLDLRWFGIMTKNLQEL